MVRRITKLTLASASPRRRSLIERLGIDFVVAPVDLDESPFPGESPERIVARLARAKARAATGEYVLAADTIVVGAAILGKPGSPEDALQMLRSLRGRAHRVLTGVAVRHRETDLTEVVATGVAMRDLSDEDVRAYVASGSPLDKAGAYGIQDRAATPVASIAGCYENVVGLPVCVVGELLYWLGFPIVRHAWFGVRDWSRCDFCRQEWDQEA